MSMCLCVCACVCARSESTFTPSLSPRLDASIAVMIPDICMCACVFPCLKCVCPCVCDIYHDHHPYNVHTRMFNARISIYECMQINV